MLCTFSLFASVNCACVRRRVVAYPILGASFIVHPVYEGLFVVTQIRDTPPYLNICKRAIFPPQLSSTFFKAETQVLLEYRHGSASVRLYIRQMPYNCKRARVRVIPPGSCKEHASILL